MATQQTRKPRGAELTAEQEARVEAIRAQHRTPEARAEEARVRETLEREYRETGTLKVAGDGTTMGDLVSFRRFILSLRRERERLGLSLADVAERRDRQGGPEPPRERPAAQPHGEYPGPVRARPRQVPRLGNGRGGRPLKLEPVSPSVAPAPSVGFACWCATTSKLGRLAPLKMKMAACHPSWRTNRQSPRKVWSARVGRPNWCHTDRKRGRSSRSGTLGSSPFFATPAGLHRRQ